MSLKNPVTPPGIDPGTVQIIIIIIINKRMKIVDTDTEGKKMCIIFCL
jgi:hypothetical protein